MVVYKLYKYSDLHLLLMHSRDPCAACTVRPGWVSEAVARAPHTRADGLAWVGTPVVWSMLGLLQRDCTIEPK